MAPSLNKPRLVLFNGPRHSGKDEAANYCVKELNARAFKMSAPLKAAIKAFFFLTDDEVDHLEATKTQPSSLLYGKSYVEVQISLSEDWGKVQWDKSLFGRIAARSLGKWIDYSKDCGLFVCSDSGFKEEALPLIASVFGLANTLLVEISRPGKSFEGDSRSYIQLDGVEKMIVVNNGTIPQYHEAISQLLADWQRPLPDETVSECTDGFCPIPSIRTGPPEAIPVPFSVPSGHYLFQPVSVTN